MRIASRDDGVISVAYMDAPAHPLAVGGIVKVTTYAPAKGPSIVVVRPWDGVCPPRLEWADIDLTKSYAGEAILMALRTCRGVAVTERGRRRPDMEEIGVDGDWLSPQQTRTTHQRWVREGTGPHAGLWTQGRHGQWVPFEPLPGEEFI